MECYLVHFKVMKGTIRSLKQIDLTDACYNKCEVVVSITLGQAWS